MAACELEARILAFGMRQQEALEGEDAFGGMPEMDGGGAEDQVELGIADALPFGGPCYPPRERDPCLQVAERTCSSVVSPASALSMPSCSRVRMPCPIAMSRSASVERCWIKARMRGVMSRNS